MTSRTNAGTRARQGAAAGLALVVAGGAAAAVTAAAAGATPTVRANASVATVTRAGHHLAPAPAAAHLSGVPKMAGPHVRLSRMPAGIAAGKMLVVDPRATTLPHGDRLAELYVDFGDGVGVVRHSLAPLPHVYRHAGVVRVIVTVTDRNGRVSRTDRRLVVRGPLRLPIVPRARAPAGPGGPAGPTGPAGPAPTTAVPTRTVTVTATPTAMPAATAPLSGRVTRNGAAQAGVLVVAVPIDGFSSYAAGSASTAPGAPSPAGAAGAELRTRTAGDGTYSFAAPVGDYWLYLNADPDAGTVDNTAFAPLASYVDVPDGGSASYSPALGDPVTLAGRVTTATSGTPATAVPATVTAVVFLGRALIESDVRTTSSGAYSITGLAPNADTFVDFLPDSDLLSEDLASADTRGGAGRTTVLDDQPVGTGAITGLVTTSHGPLTHPVAVAATGTDLMGNEVGFQLGETTATGAIDLGHLPAGTYTLLVDAPGYGDDDPTYAYAVAGSLMVTVGARTPAGTLTLTDPGTVTGTVKVGTSPAGNADVSITTNDGVYYDTSTDPDGTYRLTGMPAGAYTVMATDDHGDSGTRPVMVTAGGTTSGQDVTMVPTTTPAP